MDLITTWPKEERPREKLLNKGARSLTDAELLAIFLRTGTHGKNVIDLSREIIQHFGGLKKLMAVSQKDFCQFKGLGQAKYVQLMASIEMTQRYLAESLNQGSALKNPDEVKRYLQGYLTERKNEVFAVMFLDNQHRVLKYEELFFGTINSSSVHPRVIVQKSLTYNAAAIIIAHNHPSGIAEPSLSDIRLTSTLQETLEVVDVRLLDHMIVAGNQVISLAEIGKLNCRT